MRSSDVTPKSAEVFASGVLGSVRMSKAWNCQRDSQRRPVPSPPSHVDYDMWLGPAPACAFNHNRFHGNWNWYRDYGNGDIGGDGIHDLDMARWGLGVTTHPQRTQHTAAVLLWKANASFPTTCRSLNSTPMKKFCCTKIAAGRPMVPMASTAATPFTARKAR